MGKERKALTLKPEEKVTVDRSVAQYLKRCGFSNCFKKLLSETEIEEKELNSSLPDLAEVFCEYFKKSHVEAVEVKESGHDNEDEKKKKAASVDENASGDHETEKKDVGAVENVGKVKETDATIKDGRKDKKKKKIKLNYYNFRFLIYPKFIVVPCSGEPRSYF